MKFDGPSYVATLPELPGVYRMYNVSDELLYVGKAKRLNRRVGHYFLRPQTEKRLEVLVNQVDHMEFTVVRTETEALILEAQLIKTQHPKYNIQLKDNKGYPYIYLSSQDKFPRLSFHKGELPKKGKAFGPFPSGGAVRSSLNHLQKIFKLRTCEDVFFRNRSRPCLQHQIGRCSAPCVNLISVENYQKQVKRAVSFLEGKSDEVIQDLIVEMNQSSQSQNYEEAAQFRDQIKNLRSIQAEQHVQGKTTEIDFDIWTCSVKGDLAAITQMKFQGGASQGSRTFFPDISQVLSDLALEEDDGVSGQINCQSLLASYLPQYYLDHLVPNEVWIDENIQDHIFLQEALKNISGGKKVILREIKKEEVFKSLNDEQKRWIQWTRENKNEAFSARLKNSKTLEGRYLDLEEYLGLPMETIQRMECIDISHTQGEKPVASSVVFDRKGSLKKFYRQFNIRDITPGDDYAAIHQTVLRRLIHSEKGEIAWSLPQIWLIDGGKGQLHAALNAWEAWVMQEEDLSINKDSSVKKAKEFEEIFQRPIFIGVGKGVERKAGNETLWMIHPHQKIEEIEPWSPGAHSQALQIIQQVRDESHRFAGFHHKKQRDKESIKSPLENIEGIGPNRRRLLLNSFGGWEALLSAGIEEISKVKGISFELAQKIHNVLHRK